MILTIFLDGLRPDQIMEQHTPNILRLARRGVRFLNHHATFPTETRVNVASFVTGCYPGRHGIVGNTFYIPRQGSSWEVDTGDRLSLTHLDEETRGRALHAKSLGEILGQAGNGLASVGVGSSGNAFLQNHKAESMGGLVVHPQFTLPTSEEEELEHRFGAWPPAGTPNSARMHRATTILLDHVIPKYDPAVASLWFSEPDSAQHKTSISSPQVLQGIEAADAELGRISEYLEAKGLAASTDILVASDHGHSTVAETVDVVKELVRADLKEKTDSSKVLVAASGGCALIYVQDHEPAKVKDIAEFLMAQGWCGPLFTSSPIPGSFPLSLILSQNPRSPDILISFAWGNSQNSRGVKGTAAFAKGSVDLGGGSHGSISPYEIHSVLIAAGPHFKEGLQDPISSGSVDLLPTILHILDLSPPEAMDGRVLFEALVDGSEPEDVFTETQVYESAAKVGSTVFQQKLQISKVGSTSYLDKGKVLAL